MLHWGWFVLLLQTLGLGLGLDTNGLINITGFHPSYPWITPHLPNPKGWKAELLTHSGQFTYKVVTC